MAEEMPLFPLSTVLFPGTPLQLYIFEPRYKVMIHRCLRAKKRFGVSFIRHGVEAFGPLAEPYPIGCVAQIAHVQRLDEGDMNIVAVGIERFRLLALSVNTDAYLEAVIEPYPLEVESLAQGWEQAVKLRSRVDEYVRRLVEATGGQVNLEPIPDDPVSLAYLAAAMVQIPAQEKQRLLEINRVDELLEQLLAIFRLEKPLLDVLLQPRGEDDETLPFSRN